MICTSYFILRGSDTRIDFLRLLFLVGVISSLMQQHSFRLKKLISQVPEDAMLKIRRPVYKQSFKSNQVLHTDQKSNAKLNLSTVSVLANRCLHQNLMHSGCRGTTVPKLPLPFPLLMIFSPFPQTESLFMDYGLLRSRNFATMQT